MLGATTVGTYAYQYLPRYHDYGATHNTMYMVYRVYHGGYR